VPLPPSQASAPDLLSATPAARILLLLTDPVHGRPDATLEQRLRALWGLTAAEAVVAAQTAHGAGLPEVAQVLGLAVTTARTHAQRVFAKAGLRGQAELARQVERLSLLADEVPDSLPPRAPAHAASWSHPIA
jgi:DNA-binding CsgD family transcriptional regulator